MSDMATLALVSGFPGPFLGEARPSGAIRKSPTGRTPRAPLDAGTTIDHRSSGFFEYRASRLRTLIVMGSGNASAWFHWTARQQNAWDEAGAIGQSAGHTSMSSLALRLPDGTVMIAWVVNPSSMRVISVSTAGHQSGSRCSTPCCRPCTPVSCNQGCRDSWFSVLRVLLADGLRLVLSFLG